MDLRKTSIEKYRYLKKDISNNRYIYLMMIPVLAYFIIFKFVPMYGAQIAFKEFHPRLGIVGSPWIGMGNFISFFKSVYVVRIFRNTLLISLYSIIFSFPARHFTGPDAERDTIDAL